VFIVLFGGIVDNFNVNMFRLVLGGREDGKKKVRVWQVVAAQNPFGVSGRSPGGEVEGEKNGISDRFCLGFF